MELRLTNHLSRNVPLSSAVWTKPIHSRKDPAHETMRRCGLEDRLVGFEHKKGPINPCQVHCAMISNSWSWESLKICLINTHTQTHILIFENMQSAFNADCLKHLNSANQSGCFPFTRSASGGFWPADWSRSDKFQPQPPLISVSSAQNKKMLKFSKYSKLPSHSANLLLIPRNL